MDNNIEEIPQLPLTNVDKEGQLENLDLFISNCNNDNLTSFYKEVKEFLGDRKEFNVYKNSTESKVIYRFPIQGEGKVGGAVSMVIERELSPVRIIVKVLHEYGTSLKRFDYSAILSSLKDKNFIFIKSQDAISKKINTTFSVDNSVRELRCIYLASSGNKDEADKKEEEFKKKFKKPSKQVQTSTTQQTNLKNDTFFFKKTKISEIVPRVSSNFDRSSVTNSQNNSNNNCTNFVSTIFKESSFYGQVNSNIQSRYSEQSQYPIQYNSQNSEYQQHCNSNIQSQCGNQTQYSIQYNSQNSEYQPHCTLLNVSNNARSSMYNTLQYNSQTQPEVRTSGLSRSSDQKFQTYKSVSEKQNNDPTPTMGKYVNPKDIIFEESSLLGEANFRNTLYSQHNQQQISQTQTTQADKHEETGIQSLKDIYKGRGFTSGETDTISPFMDKLLQVINKNIRKSRINVPEKDKEGLSEEFAKYTFDNLYGSLPFKGESGISDNMKIAAKLSISFLSRYLIEREVVNRKEFERLTKPIIGGRNTNCITKSRTLARIKEVETDFLGNSKKAFQNDNSDIKIDELYSSFTNGLSRSKTGFLKEIFDNEQQQCYCR